MVGNNTKNGKIMLDNYVINNKFISIKIIGQQENVNVSINPDVIIEDIEEFYNQCKRYLNAISRKDIAIQWKTGRNQDDRKIWIRQINRVL